MRVFEIARVYGLSRQAVMERLADAGVPAKAASSSVSDDVVERVFGPRPDRSKLPSWLSPSAGNAPQTIRAAADGDDAGELPEDESPEAAPADGEDAVELPIALGPAARAFIKRGERARMLAAAGEAAAAAAASAVNPCRNCGSSRPESAPGRLCSDCDREYGIARRMLDSLPRQDTYDAAKFSRFNGTCRECDAHYSIVVHRGDDAKYWCGDCRVAVFMRRVVGTMVPGTSCDPKCWNAWEDRCKCSCGGINHGSGHSIN